MQHGMNPARERVVFILLHDLVRAVPVAGQRGLNSRNREFKR
jgi:hypothetical protein